MTRSDEGDDDDRERRAHLPIEAGTQKLDDLEPYQREIERAASLYFSGCRTVARMITAIKDQLSDGGDEQ